MLRELGSKLGELFALIPVDRTAAATGSTIDRQGYSALLFLFNVGAIALGDSSNYMSLIIEESDDASSWSTYSTVKALTVAGTDLNKVYSGSYNGDKRYARASITETGTAQATVGAVAVGLLQHQP